MILFHSLTRILALVGKELVEVVRAPKTLASLVAGPFLILVVFGLGYSGIRPPIHAIVVAPPAANLPVDTATYQGHIDGLIVDAVVPDRGEADRRLAERAIDAVVVFPPDLRDRFLAGQRSKIEVDVNMVDPAQVAIANVMAGQVAERVNQTLIAKAAEAGQASVGGTNVPPDVVAAPTEATLVNVAPATPGVVDYFAPAVIALILQHLCVTLVALSLMRERTSGMLELYRVGPTSAWEIVAAKLLGFGAIGAIIAGLSFTFASAILHAPMLGSPAMLVTVVALLLAASIGIGIVIAMVSDTERMAVQTSLLVLLASIFFSGFVIDLALFQWPIQAIGGLLPVTQAIRQLHDVMLLGTVGDSRPMAVLGMIAIVSISTGWLQLRRSMAPIR